ncbi:MAG: (2Fe-2S)-binding protein [Planctomycetes bacterium]|nr:(2Fe-2S)-binding protein [Planctomycetota bacterium]MCB9902954.1 (2Fe-2S)-binding protein [Planctomycetota bacterium]
MIQGNQITVDGRLYDFREGETLLDVTSRARKRVPTLCHDPRLDPAGACRTCLVEVDGWKRMPPACATRAQAGMVVRTQSDRIDEHRRALFALYLSDQPVLDPNAPGKDCELHAMAQEFGAPTDWPKLESLRANRDEDRNPYIRFHAEKCILCARCTRYCDEVEQVTAITLARRGAETTISTSDRASLFDTSCELCGGCVDVCPTGAMAEKLPLTSGAKPDRELEKVRTTCNYCGVGCQLELNVDRAANDGAGRVVKVTSPPVGTLPNDGNLCVKGRFAYDFIDHPDRLTVPLVRAEDGRLVEASWDEALQRVADGMRGVAERHGKDSLAFVSSSRCTVEENYLVQKLARAVYGTNNVHQCAAT